MGKPPILKHASAPSRASFSHLGCDSSRAQLWPTKTKKNKSMDVLGIEPRTISIFQDLVEVIANEILYP